MELIERVEEELKKKRTPLKTAPAIEEKIDRITADVKKIAALLSKGEECKLIDSEEDSLSFMDISNEDFLFYKVGYSRIKVRKLKLKWLLQ